MIETYELAALVVWPILLALVAGGGVLFIKTLRRRQGTLDPRHTDAVPVNPMSEPHARRLRRRYLLVATSVLAVLLVVVLVLLASR